MSDRRLSSDDPIAGALFAAARSYRPPVSLRRRTMRALGVPVGLSLVGSVLAHAAQAAAPFKGWILAGALTAASAGGGALYLSQHLAAPAPAVTTPAPRPVVMSPRPSPVMPPRPAPVMPPASSPPPPPVAVAVEAPAPVRAPRPKRLALVVPPAPVAAPAPAPEPALVPPPQPVVPPPIAPARPTGSAPAPMPMLQAQGRTGLEAELYLIETARRELAGAPRLALATLDEYSRTFPRGVLGEEAEILRLSALSASGASAEAAARATAFLAAHPGSPLAARARTFLTPTTRTP